MNHASAVVILVLLLIPGNFPNIVSAGTLKIRSAAWAKIGVPMGLVMLGIYFAVIKLLG